MEGKVEVINIYNLLNPNGDPMQMLLGRIVDKNGRAVVNGKDKGWRWCVAHCKHNPTLFRKGEWYNSFPEETMLYWLKEHGWAVRTIVNASTHEVKVFDLPEAPNAPEVPNTPATETDWIPISSGVYPKEGESVQVTYIDYSDGVTRYCDGVAFHEGNDWFWSICDEPLLCTITAWRPVGTPYMEDTTAKATEPEYTEDEGHLYYVNGGNEYGWFTSPDNARAFHDILFENTGKKPYVYKGTEIHF